MSGRLDGKVAIITGGGSGIGRATALAFLRESARVVIGDLNEAGLAETVALARAEGHADRLAALRGDVSAELHVAGLVGAGGRALPGARLRLQQRGGRRRVRPHRRDHRGGVGLHVRGAGARRVPRHQARVESHEGPGPRRQHHQYRVGRGHRRRRRPARLLRGQGRGGQPHPLGVHGAGRPPHPGQRDRPGHDPDAARHRPAGRSLGPPGAGEAAVAGAGPAAAHRGHRALPRRRGVPLHHRPGDRGGRRADRAGPRSLRPRRGSRMLRKAGLNTGSTGLPGTVREVRRP